MSWIKCRCGHVIHDNTDMQRDKAYIMAHQDEPDYYDTVEKIIKSENGDKERTVDDFVFLDGGIRRTMYQCTECGRIYINDGKGNKFFCFKPEGHENKNITRSIFGENWKGMLYGEWRDADWVEHKGFVGTNTNIGQAGFVSESKKEITDEYYRLFEELKDKGVLRYAYLRINQEIIHKWEEDINLSVLKKMLDKI